MVHLHRMAGGGAPELEQVADIIAGIVLARADGGDLTLELGYAQHHAPDRLIVGAHEVDQQIVDLADGEGERLGHRMEEAAQPIGIEIRGIAEDRLPIQLLDQAVGDVVGGPAIALEALALDCMDRLGGGVHCRQAATGRGSMSRRWISPRGSFHATAMG